MKILLTQAERTENISLLKDQIAKIDCDIIMYPEGYISNERLLNEVCQLSKEFNKPIISSYLDDIYHKDNNVVVDEYGNEVLKRKKSNCSGPIIGQTKTRILNMKIGYLLCCEIFLAKEDYSDCDIIFNPIGVGMFSEEQFIKWTAQARKLALKNKCKVIEVSHADGSFKNCGTSIPICYYFDKDGTEVYLSHNDTRSVVIDLLRNSVEYV